jgi:hypothetical protein
MLGNVKSTLAYSKINYDVLIDNVEKAIEEENVPLSVEMQAELAGRKGLRLLQTY